MTSRRYNLISACLAFLMWGGWAFYVNRSGEPWISGLVQGTGSFLITLLMVWAVTALYQRCAHLSFGVFLPAFLIVAVTGSCLALAHYIVGTQNILKTIAPALCVALLFNMYTAVKLKRQGAMGSTPDSLGDQHE